MSRMSASVQAGNHDNLLLKDAVEHAVRKPLEQGTTRVTMNDGAGVRLLAELPECCPHLK